MKTEITKTEITRVLNGVNAKSRRERVTNIFSLANKMGIDVSNKGNVFRFINEHGNSKVQKEAYSLSYGASYFKDMRCEYIPGKKSDIIDAIDFAKLQKTNGWMDTSHGKVLIIGTRDIYWACPFYKHSDYNKSRAMENTPKNRRVADVINRYLSK